MSTFEVKVVKVGALRKHPNADSLEITRVWGYPVITKIGQFKEGDLAAYVPVDSVVDTKQPEFTFLDGRPRIRAAKLRGTYSEGLLITARPGWNEGDNVADQIGCKKYEQPEDLRMGGENESEPDWFAHYTDIENLKRYPNILQPGELVCITEKIHGANGRWAFRDEKFWVGSHNNCKRIGTPNPTIWERALDKTPGFKGLVQALKGYIIYGEVFGPVQDLRYGAKQNDLFVRLFDLRDVTSRNYLSHDEVWGLGLLPEQKRLLMDLWVPDIYKGTWRPDLVGMAEGKTHVLGADHIREGIVIKPGVERWNDEVGRVIFKVIGEGYRLRKGGTEHK